MKLKRANELGNWTDRFKFYNGRYSLRSEKWCGNDVNYVEYLQNTSNIQLINPLERFNACTKSGRCCGMSLLSMLVHNGVFSSSDIQEGTEKLIDVNCNTLLSECQDDPVMSKILAYQLRQDKIDFNLLMKWSLSHYNKSEQVDYLLETAKKANQNGKYFLLAYHDTNLWHAVTGIGIMDGEWEWYGKKYDKCILTIDTNVLHEDEETSDIVSYGCTENACLFVNSETKEVCIPFYFDPEQSADMICGEDFKVFTLDDDNFVNYKEKINPSDSYDTKISDIILDISSVTVKNENKCDITVTDIDNTIYDGISECKAVFPNDGDEYVMREKDFKVQNTENAEDFGINFIDINHAVYTDFKGAANNIFYNSDEFNFDVSAPTDYNVSMVFEEGSYNFTPHYRFDFSGNTDNDFKAVQTDKGIILSSSDKVKCQVKVNDIIRDEQGLVSLSYTETKEEDEALKGYIVSPEEKIQKDAVTAVGNVLLTFDENGSLKYYTGENFDTEVQKGDVNCDGFIDAVDATLVLEAYAANSTDKSAYVGKTLGDCNGDDFVDANDASYILEKYAELSTK